MKPIDLPEPGSVEEKAAYATLQERTKTLYRALSADQRIPQTVVIVPSLSMDPRELKKVVGVTHYEERMLVNLMLLRQPRTRIIYVTSKQLDPVIVDYYLALLPGLPTSHVRRRLKLLHCADARNDLALTQKVLMRPRLIAEIRSLIDDPEFAHMVCFNSTPWERTLSVRLGIPLNSVDPELNYLGTKSGCREVFRAAGVLLPFGFERLSTHQEVAETLAEIKRRDPDARRAVVKLNEGFSGEGNALFYYEDLASTEGDLQRKIYDRLPTGLRFEAPNEHWDSFIGKYAEMEGVVESFVEGENKESPSAQCRITAVHEAQVISTHDQVLGGPSGQVFLGCTFPAHDDYRLEIQESGAKVAEELAKRGVIGRFGIDYVSVPKPEGGYEHYAIEVNLRKGGTTHPFLTLKFLTSGRLELEDGLFYAPSGRPKYYFATDTLQDERYAGLRPQDLVDIAVYHDLHFHGPTERGVVFHLIGALSEHGKVGVVAIGDNLQQARFLYQRTLQVLDEETGQESD